MSVAHEHEREDDGERRQNHKEEDAERTKPVLRTQSRAPGLAGEPAQLFVDCCKLAWLEHSRQHLWQGIGDPALRFRWILLGQDFAQRDPTSRLFGKAAHEEHHRSMIPHARLQPIAPMSISWTSSRPA